MPKDICILLGSGFSSAVAGMPSLASISTSIQEALLNNDYLSDSFKELTIKDLQNDPWNYEKCCELVAYLRLLINSEDRAKYFFKEKGDIKLHEKSIHAAEEVIYQEVLNQLIKVSNKKKHKKLRKNFEQMILKLTTQGYIVHIFDLNHDLVVDSIFNDPNKEFKYENFFRQYESQPYGLPNIPIGSGKTTLYLMHYRQDLMYSNESNIFHYKMHGSLNIASLLGMPFGGKNLPKHYIAGPHLALAFKKNGRPDYGEETKNALLKVFQEGTYKNVDKKECKITSSIINIGSLKSKILTTDALQYFPDCYSQFSKLGSRGAAIFSIGYSFRDSHINHIIQRHFDSEIYGPYYKNHAAKIFFSGKEDIPLITDPLNKIKYFDNGIMKNNLRRKILCSDKYFEEYIN